jgi:hypothetical protein
MGKYKMIGHELHFHNRKIAVMRGDSIYDADNRRVGTIQGDVLLDTTGKTMMNVRDGDIYDADNKKVAGLSEVEETIDGMAEGIIRSALWYCFVR